MKNRSYPLITRFSASPLQSLLHVHNMRACALWHLLRDTAKDAEGLVFAILMTELDLVQLTTGSKATVKRARIRRWMVISIEEREKKTAQRNTVRHFFLCPLNRTVSANKPYFCLTVTLCSVFLMAQCSCVGDDHETKKNKKKKNI